MPGSCIVEHFGEGGRQDDSSSEEASPKLEVIPTESYDTSVDESPAAQRPSSRAEASLEQTPRGAIVSPASLPSSQPCSRGSDAGEESFYNSCSPTSEPVETGSLLGPPSLPGSLVPGDLGDFSFQCAEASRVGRAASPAQPLRPSPISMQLGAPESSDFIKEDKEIERLSSLPEFITEQAQNRGFEMLHFVAMLGHASFDDALKAGTTERHQKFARIAKCLVQKHKHKLDVVDKYGCTPLQLAAACGNVEMVKMLLDAYGFDCSGRQVLPQSNSGYKYVNHQDDQIRFSALHGAVSHNEYETVILLLKYGANPQVLDVTRSTAFKASPTLASLQELLRLVVQHADEVPRPVIVHLMAEVLEKQLKEAGSPQPPAPVPPPASATAPSPPPTAPAGGTRGAGGAPADGGAGTSGVSARSSPMRTSPSTSDIPDLRAQRQFKAQQRWSKATKMLSFHAADSSLDPGHRFEAAALEMVGLAQHSDVGSTIKRHFEELYTKERHDVMVDYVTEAIDSNQHMLTKMMIDMICNECPDVLASPNWHETLEPLVSSYPTLFHRLLFKLQGMRDEHVRGFVRCLSPAKFQTSTEVGGRPTSAAAGHSQRIILGSRTHAADRVKLLIYQQLVEGLKKVSYRVVKTFFEESDQRLLNDMAQFPIFADFVGIIANMQTAKAFDESDSSRKRLLELLRASAKQVPPSRATSMQRQDTPPTGPHTPGAAATALEGPTGGVTQVQEFQGQTGGAAAAGGGAGRPASRPSGSAPLAWQPKEPRNTYAKNTSSKVSFKLEVHTPGCDVLTLEGGGSGSAGSGRLPWNAIAPAPPIRPTSAAPNSIAAPGPPERGGTGGGGGGGILSALKLSGQGRRQNILRSLVTGGGRDSRDGLSCSGQLDEAIRQRERLSLQTLNVFPVMSAAVKAGKAYNVERTVMSIISWVETNNRDGKAVFLSGINADLIKELAMRFPSSCATLLNLVSRDVLAELTTLQVSASVLYGKDHLVKCSHVRNHFTWREQELRKLLCMQQGYDEHVVDALVDYGVPFECIYKAAVEMGGPTEGHATPEHFAKLIEHEFSGPELKLLISNGIRLSKVIAYIEECAKPLPDGVPSDFSAQLDVPMAELLQDMLREKLSPRIVDIILREEKMFETTRYNNFRPGRPLRRTYPENLFFPQYTHHFVQMLLINWRRGGKSEKGELKPWAKEFIDSIFEPNDPLCTKLKSAYDNKLTDTQVYIQGENVADIAESEYAVQLREQQWREQREREQREHVQHIRQLLRIFISNPFLVHRWPVYLAAQLYLSVHSYLHMHWQRLDDVWHRERAKRFGHQVSVAKKARSGTIDAAVLAFPILGIVQPADGDILTALVDADAPSSWFHYAIVRALYGLHWSQFGRVMILLSAAAQLQFALVFLTFFLLVLNYRPADYGEDLDWLAKSVVVQGVLVTAAGLSATMLLERVQESSVQQLGTWVFFGRLLELICHGMVWAVAVIVWSGKAGSLVAALSGLTMLLFVGRLTLYGLVTEKLSTAVLALMEIVSDSRYFFLLIFTVYGGFVLAVAGLRLTDGEPQVYSSQLFTVLLGDFQSTQLTEDTNVWRFTTFSLVLLSVYAILMLIVFMNLLIATMNDTYDRVKEFREVEVMRLRAHMMVFVKNFVKRNCNQTLATLDGDVLHLLLRPEEVKSGRWLSQAGSEPSEYNAWAGRITYMRSTIVREVETSLREQTDRTGDQLKAIEQRLAKFEHGGSGGAAVADRLEAMEKRLEEALRAVQAATGAQLMASGTSASGKMPEGAGT